MYDGGIQALKLLKADKELLRLKKKIPKEEDAFANWLQKNNPNIAKRLMKTHLKEKKRKKQKTEEAVTTAKDLTFS
jgi:hypothetical protein